MKKKKSQLGAALKKIGSETVKQQTLQMYAVVYVVSEWSEK